MKTIDAKSAKHWLDTGEAIIIDVREPAEHAAIAATPVQSGRLGPIAATSWAAATTLASISRRSSHVSATCRPGGSGNGCAARSVGSERG